MRINKAMAKMGICSRRDADELIKNQRVFVNSKLVTDFSTQVQNKDKITIRDTPYRDTSYQNTPCRNTLCCEFNDTDNTRVWIFNKPTGLVTSHKDEKGRKTVFDYLKNKINQRVISVGRLDMNSEGLLLLTNNGDFVNFAESSNWKRYYKVRFLGQMTKDIIKKLASKMIINNQRYAPIIIQQDRQYNSKNQWCTCILTEGKNREIRKVFEHFGLIVNRLIRIKYGPYELGNLPVGEVKEVRKLK